MPPVALPAIRPDCLSYYTCNYPPPNLQVAPYLALSLTGYETLKALGAYLEERKPLQRLLGT